MTSSEPLTWSPSARRAWIEIANDPDTEEEVLYGRPPHGGRGLKYGYDFDKENRSYVALRTEGVD